MRIRTEYRIWEAAAPKNDPRLIYQMIKIEAEGTAVASDGIILAAIEVELEPGDVPGLVPADVLKAAHRLAPKGAEYYTLVLGEETVILADATIYLRPGQDLVYPDYVSIVPRVSQARSKTVISLNPVLLAKAYRAMGGGHIKITFPRDNMAMLTDVSNGMVARPYSLIMLMHM